MHREAGGGVGAECGAKLNVENSMFRCLDNGSCSASRRDNGIIYGTGCSAKAQIYSRGSVAPGASLRPGNTLVEFPRPTPEIPLRKTACEMAHDAYDRAGVRPLDAIDRAALAAVTLPACQ